MNTGTLQNTLSLSDQPATAYYSEDPPKVVQVLQVFGLSHPFPTEYCLIAFISKTFLGQQRLYLWEASPLNLFQFRWKQRRRGSGAATAGRIKGNEGGHTNLGNPLAKEEALGQCRESRFGISRQPSWRLRSDWHTNYIYFKTWNRYSISQQKISYKIIIVSPERLL